MLVVLWTRLQTRAGLSALLLLPLITLTFLPLTTASRSTLERLTRALHALEDMVTEPRPCARCCPGGAGGGQRVLTLEEMRGDVRGLLRQGVSSRDLLRTVVWELYTMNSASVVQPSFNAFYDEMRTKLVPLDDVGPAHPELQPPSPSQGRSAEPSGTPLQGLTNCHTLPSPQRPAPRRTAAGHRDIHINGLQAGTRDGVANNTNADQQRLSPALLARTRLAPALGRRPPSQSTQLTESQPLINHDHQRVRPGILSPPPVSSAGGTGCAETQAADPPSAAPPGTGGTGGEGGRVNGRPVSAPTTTRRCANLPVHATPSHTPHTKSSSSVTETSTRHGPPKGKHLLPITLWRDAPVRGMGRMPPKPAPLQVIIIDPVTSNGGPRSYKQYVTLQPSSGVYDILRKSSLEYEMKAGNEFKNNPFTFQLGKFQSTCYILRSVMDWRVTTEEYWTITVEDSNRKVLFDDICIPNKHHLPMRPGYTIYLNYSPLPDGRRAILQTNKGGQHAPAEQ